MLQEQMERLAAEVNAGKGDLILFNDLPFERTALVKHPADGKEFLATLPPMGYAPYTGNGAGEFTRITELSPYGGKVVSAENGTKWKLIDNNELYYVFESSTVTDFTKVIQRITVHHRTKKSILM